jgi:hypothetical protein
MGRDLGENLTAFGRSPAVYHTIIHQKTRNTVPNFQSECPKPNGRPPGMPMDGG